MQYFHDVYSETVTAASLFEAFDLVDFNDARIATDDAAVKGVAKHPATEVGLDVAVMMIGTARLRARGIIARGEKVISAAAGGVRAAEGGSVNVFGRALTAAADGEFITVYFCAR